MASGYTVFVTYLFESSPYTGTTGTSGSYGYTTPIHCANYQTITTDTLTGKAVSIYFDPDAKFPFLAGTGSTNGTGFTATSLKIIAQVVNEISDSTTTVVPDPSGWYVYDVTDQIPNHTLGDIIDRDNLVDVVYTAEFVQLTTPYVIDYLNYPLTAADSDEMGFGEETVFFGTVRTDIRATVYTSDISINLSASEYNTSTNPTWDGSSDVAISEVAIYDDNDNLVAMGKLNYPINKNSSIARVIAFNIDF